MEKMKTNEGKNGSAKKAREENIEQVKKFRDVVRITGQWIYKLRSVILAIPVVVASIVLAVQNMERLPPYVGINIQPSGEYAIMLERSVAVSLPLLVTAGCLLMVFLSRKVLYPWLISVFSLVLPVLLWITNVFPG